MDIMSVSWDPGNDTAVFMVHEGYRDLSLSQKIKAMEDIARQMTAVRAELLSPTEREVVEYTLRGLRSVEICKIMGMSKSAIDTTRSRAMDKLGTRGVVQLAVAAAGGPGG